MPAPTPDQIRNHHPDMDYRRFGRTDRWLSAITLGGMRYHDVWGGDRTSPVPQMIDQCAEITQLAFDHGINHIETAYGYGKSEYCYGIALNEVLKTPRDTYHLMTKGSPRTAEDTKKMIDEQLTGLRTDHIDLYAWHGINTPEKLAEATAPGGAIETLHELKEQGVIGTIGFSTHGPVDVIIDALATDLFDFVNLHYYYFLQRNRGAVDYAGAKDYGVFIISPNDKGGRLFEPGERLTDLCAPLSPIQFNAKWCLSDPNIHTLSFGLSEAPQFEEMRGIFPAHVPLSPEELAIRCRMDSAVLANPVSAYEGWELLGDPSGINVPEVLRHLRMATAYGHDAFGHYRYNMFNEKGDWFPGAFATPDRVAQLDTSTSPVEADVAALLSDAHDRFYKPKEEKAGG